MMKGKMWAAIREAQKSFDLFTRATGVDIYLKLQVTETGK